MNARIAIPVLLTALLTIASPGAAAPPAEINIHGQIVGPTGTPLTGTRAYEVTFYDAETGGNVLGAVQSGMATLSGQGLFNSSVTPPAEILSAGAIWYSLGVDKDEPADGDASDDVFPARIQVHSVPFALQAAEVVQVDADRVGAGAISNTEFGTLDNASGNLQSQIDAIDTSGIQANASDIAQNAADIIQNAADIALKANSADVYTQAAADTNFLNVSGDTMSGALSVDSINEASTNNGVAVDGVMLQDGYIELSAGTAPGDTSGKLYNVGGSLFFNGTAVDVSMIDKDAINNAGTLGFDWNDSELADALTIQGGTVDNDSFSALSDLQAESAIGAGSGQVSAGNHGHMLQSLSGAVTDGQVTNALTVQGGSVNNDSFSALSDLQAESAIGTGSGQVSAGNHDHMLQNLGGAVTDGQVPDNITITEADTLASVTGRGASTSTALTFSGGISTDSIGEVTSDNGVDADGVLMKDSFVELSNITEPATTANRLYASGGDLFWNTTRVSSPETVDTIMGLVSTADFTTFSDAAYGVGFGPSFTFPRYTRFKNFRESKVITNIDVFHFENTALPLDGTFTTRLTIEIVDIATGTANHTVGTYDHPDPLPASGQWDTVTLAVAEADRTVDAGEYVRVTVSEPSVGTATAGQLLLSLRLTVE